MFRPATLARAAVAACLVAPAGEAATLVVDTTGDPQTASGLCSLRWAMAAAALNAPIDGCPPGDAGLDTILLGPGTYRLHRRIVLNGGEPFVIAGAGIGATTIAPEPGIQEGLFYFSNGTEATLQELGLRDGEAWEAESSQFGGGIRAVDADLALRLVMFQSNRASAGGALSFVTSDEARHLRVESCLFAANRADEASKGAGAVGAGAYVDLQAAASSARFVDSYFIDNVASGILAIEIGAGGLHLGLAAGTTGEVLRTAFLQNRAETWSEFDAVAGVTANVLSGGTLRIRDSRFSANQAAGPSDDYATALRATVFGGLEIDRSIFEVEDQGTGNRHLDVYAGAGSDVRLTNLLIADGPAVGLAVRVESGGSARLGHLTVTNHGQCGVHLDAFAPSWLENSILWQNDVDLRMPGAVPPTRTANLVGVDPRFVSPGTGDYGLAVDSPAVGSGDRSVASVRFADAAHAPRVVGPNTDIGAFERRGIFADDFEVGDAGAWSSAAR